jgi:hypothetical protein
MTGTSVTYGQGGSGNGGGGTGGSGAAGYVIVRYRIA